MRRILKWLAIGAGVLTLFLCGLSFAAFMVSDDTTREQAAAPASTAVLTDEDQASDSAAATDVDADIPNLPAATAVPPTPTSVPATPTLVQATATQTVAGDIGLVTAVIDGDTIDVRINGTEYRVRYIGIDTPEAGDPCGSEATAANANLVAGKEVRLVRDVSETDRYGRLLRYVYVGDTFVNGRLVADGWAVAKEYQPDTAMAGVLQSLEAEGVGLGCALVGAPVRGPSSLATPGAAGDNCDPSYPTVCIPRYPPDLNCSDISYRKFKVLPPDPHGFDGSGDGVGCEGN